MLGSNEQPCGAKTDRSSKSIGLVQGKKIDVFERAHAGYRRFALSHRFRIEAEVQPFPYSCDCRGDRVPRMLRMVDVPRVFRTRGYDPTNYGTSQFDKF